MAVARLASDCARLMTAGVVSSPPGAAADYRPSPAVAATRCGVCFVATALQDPLR